ncbi:hypothetical protein HYPSUDRAFT_59963 [Hypholoma sublateritium FD-334 SS-4]|uniref:Uncharacterized protein n=1 Tax=Hypholoma sublateritium (strain FD-334 SS-4) TaxID=945553 RepID=A0A0D2NXX8_HYPSF|nr:hypothetical protein HYPSUDRAFT_59963 [Hypholoma sublateritium FD-334 SS-4]
MLSLGVLMCQKTYEMTGNLETEIKLGIPNRATGINSTEWAYLPYIESSPTANGPLDLIPAPLSRTGCWTVMAGDNKSAPLEANSNDLVNVTWNIAFSGRTPNNFHPRVMIVIKSACRGLYAFAQILRLHYWFSRSTTVGISFTGTYLLTFGFLVEYAVKSLRDSYSTGPTATILRLLAGPKGLPATITMIFMTGGRAYAAVIYSFGIRYIGPPFFSSEYFQIFAKSVRGTNGALPVPDPRDKITELSMLIISLPAVNLGNALQAILNLRRKTFGGNYHLSAWVYAGASIILLIVDTPGTLYRATFDVVLPWDAVTGLLLTAIFAIQAVVYMAASQEDQVMDE